MCGDRSMVLAACGAFGWFASFDLTLSRCLVGVEDCGFCGIFIVG